MDGIPPPCRKGGEEPGVDACWIPPLSPEEARVLELRSRLVALNGLVDPGTILRGFGVTIEEVDLLAAVEDELRATEKEGNG